MGTMKIDPKTGLPQTKLLIIQDLMAAEKWVQAISAAARLPVLGAQRGAILTAHGAVTNPNFYRQLGHDPNVLIEAGISALRERFEK
jgi:hypothetical protein